MRAAGESTARRPRVGSLACSPLGSAPIEELEASLPNTFAYIMLFGWPLVCIVLFVRLPLEAAAIWSLLAGYLLLPSAASLDLHLLPPLDKSTIPAVSTYLLCLMKGTSAPPPRRPFVVYLLAFCFVVSPIFSTLNNSYELRIGDRSIPGFYPLDGVKLVLNNIITVAPFFVGLRALSSDKGRALLLKSIAIAALVYSLPMLFELRMSPQLQRLIYGAAPSAFAHLVRAGGYRPVVFLSTGLELALFTGMAFVAAIVALRCRWRLLSVPPGAAAGYLGVLLLLCKTMGPIIYGAVCAPLVYFTGPKTWVRVSCVVILIICAYPMLRTYDIIPVRRVVAAASTVSADRAGSLQFRIENEDKLLAKANQKPYLGWGTWGRNRVFDQETGTDMSITDGEWILRFGMFGWLGYLSLFGVFAAAAFSALSSVKGPVTLSAIHLGALTLLLAINLTDLIPNANLLPLTYLIAGSIAGRARVKAKVAALSRRKTVTPASKKLELARQASL